VSTWARLQRGTACELLRHGSKLLQVDISGPSPSRTTPLSQIEGQFEAWSSRYRTPWPTYVYLQKFAAPGLE